MVKSKDDLTGKVFGRLTVLKQVEDYISPSGKHYAQWLCECSCNDHKQTVATTQNLKRGNTKSCGCNLKKENHYILNLIDEHGSYGIGYCHNTGTPFYFDMCDYDKIKEICWVECTRHGMQCVIGRNTQTKQTIAMHIYIGYKLCDHEDRNELNNRRYNLRPATTIENSRNKNRRVDNTSGFIGVSFVKQKSQWRARVHIHGEEIHLGYFLNKEDAIIERLKAEKKYYGEFAPQRHLFKEYGIV